MALRFAINGFGRIGRALFRLAWDQPEVEVVAVNDVVSPAILARLLARDSVHGPFAGGRVEAGEAAILVAGRRIPVLAEAEPGRVAWSSCGAEVVVEATGRFLGRAQAAAHLGGTVRLVVLTANSDPADPADETVCFGINHDRFAPASGRVVSNSSCTTNALALVVKVLHERFGVRRASMTTVHSVTENQRLLDLPHPDPRRSRAATLNIIPTSTTAPRALGGLIPELAGRVEGLSVRVPTPAAAMLELVAELDREASAEAVREAFRQAAAGPLAGYLGVTDDELVSSDFIGEARSAVVDLPLVRSIGGRMVTVVAWYDNEWGYAHRLVDLLLLIARRPVIVML